MREAAWIVLAAAGIYLALVLATFSRSDPGPSFSGSGAPLVNKGGMMGAWLADAFYYVFGMSAWWWVALAVVCILRLYRRVERWELLSRRTLALSLTGFVLVLAASCTLEAMRLHGPAQAAGFAAGGAVGTVLASGIGPLLGFTGATLVLLAVLAGGLAIFTGLSWMRVAELTGAGLEWAYSAARHR
ncbi:MAG TPA: DNA translocase FtsK 4TM domain-containing protein, partial [Usitatibacter sp.]|nr:DNA translocase FtsK 4TM domain-containing protein [Usitatibacter sp.]